MTDKIQNMDVRPPKFVQTEQWEGYQMKPWLKKDRKKVTVMFNFLERRKSYFLAAYFHRKKMNFIDMGDHVKEDVTYGKLYGNRMECNPMYFTSGSMIRNLLKIEKETGLSREEIARRYIFLCGGGQCGPCRYGMYPQEYLKVANEAGFKDFRVLIFSSDIGRTPGSGKHAFKFDLPFRINLGIALILADLMHAAECALRAYAIDCQEAEAALDKADKMIRKAFESRFYLWTLPRVLKRIGRMFAAIPRRDTQLPLIYVTGEFFANLAHNDGNYHLRRFITDEGCEVIPGSFTQRTLYDNWRRTVEAERGIRYATSSEEIQLWKKSLKKQRTSTAVIRYFYDKYCEALQPESFRARTELMDMAMLAELAKKHYHPEIFGGEGNLEIAEAIHLAQEDAVDGFISSKPFGCMPSSGVSDGVQAKVLAMFPELNFLSIETSGDNDVSILSRVSMLLLKAKQRHAHRHGNATSAAPVPIEELPADETVADTGRGRQFA
jgi:predicted nucleotide-binding protein (sugar kinase/HSP70/actin superfamily)